jgi:hypothetical protein
MTPPRRTRSPGLLLWLNTTVKSRAGLIAERGVAREEMTVRPEDTLTTTKRTADVSRLSGSDPAGHGPPWAFSSSACNLRCEWCIGDHVPIIERGTLRVIDAAKTSESRLPDTVGTGEGVWTDRPRDRDRSSRSS